jgi:hypothetical protein
VVRFYFHPTPTPAKVTLVLEERGLAYQVVPIDTSKRERHSPAFRAINPNGKVPAIVDTDGPGGVDARVFVPRHTSLPGRQEWALRRLFGQSAGAAVMAFLHRHKTRSFLRSGRAFPTCGSRKDTLCREPVSTRN